MNANPQQEFSLFVCSVLVVLLAPLVSGCSLFSSECEEVEHEACGGGFSERVRIIPGKGVDGVEFGDSIDDVYEKLGPKPGLGWADGIHRSWRLVRYKEGAHAGLLVNFIEEAGGRPGPVGMFILLSDYRGKTKRGIGIGSTLNDVKRAYGVPAQAPEGGGDGHYTYCFGDRHFNLGIQSDTVNVINLGYYIPMPEVDSEFPVNIYCVGD